jgi:hypothetical protein
MPVAPGALPGGWGESLGAQGVDAGVLYVTPVEFALSPFAPLLPEGWSAAQVEALLRAASAQADRYCRRVFQATVNTETLVAQETPRCIITPEGLVRLHVRDDPVLAVLSASWQGLAAGAVPAAFEAAALRSGTENVIWIAADFRAYRGSRQRIQITVSYVNGYPNSRLVAPAAAGATSVAVRDATGMQPGVLLRLVDGADETARVAAASGNVLTLAAPLAADHAAGAGITALPDDVRLAVCYLAADLLADARGQGAAEFRLGDLQMSLRDRQSRDPGHSAGPYAKRAHQLLEPFVRTSF